MKHFIGAKCTLWHIPFYSDFLSLSLSISRSLPIINYRSDLSIKPFSMSHVCVVVLVPRDRPTTNQSADRPTADKSSIQTNGSITERCRFRGSLITCIGSNLIVQTYKTPTDVNCARVTNACLGTPSYNKKKTANARKKKQECHTTALRPLATHRARKRI